NGIRDRNVTGVQTCALPIFGDELDARGAGGNQLGLVLRTRKQEAGEERLIEGREAAQPVIAAGRKAGGAGGVAQLPADRVARHRSEGRRVGRGGGAEGVGEW